MKHFFPSIFLLWQYPQIHTSIMVEEVTLRHICDALAVIIWNLFAWYKVMKYSYNDLEFLRDSTVEKWI